jgi:hypothetical protein
MCNGNGQNTYFDYGTPLQYHDFVGTLRQCVCKRARVRVRVRE